MEDYFKDDEVVLSWWRRMKEVDVAGALALYQVDLESADLEGETEEQRLLVLDSLQRIRSAAAAAVLALDLSSVAVLKGCECIAEGMGLADRVE